MYVLDPLFIRLELFLLKNRIVFLFFIFIFSLSFFFHFHGLFLFFSFFSLIFHFSCFLIIIINYFFPLFSEMFYVCVLFPTNL
jgi:hypothetical protein